MAKLPYAKIPKFIQTGNYEIHLPWHMLESGLKNLGQGEGVGLDLDPPYQRGHVWTEAQQRAYVEFVIRGGNSSKTLLFNCPGWPNYRADAGPVELVDGKQRLTAVLRFIHNELTVFDDFLGIGPTRWDDLEIKRDMELRFLINVNHLNTRAEVLDWYLQLNAGGTPHTPEELDKVRRMREEASK